MNKDLLQKYVVQNYSQREIAELESCSQSRIRYWLDKYKLITIPYVDKKVAKCLGCEKAAHNKYCSLLCQQAYQRKIIYENISSTGIVQSKNPRIAKAYLNQKYGYKCTNCGLAEWLSKPILLILDHIDGNADNWKLNNLRLICSNCDAQTLTYKGKNKGNGRHSRRKRYQEGKSY